MTGYVLYVHERFVRMTRHREWKKGEGVKLIRRELVGFVGRRWSVRGSVVGRSGVSVCGRSWVRGVRSRSRGWVGGLVGGWLVGWFVSGLVRGRR